MCQTQEVIQYLEKGEVVTVSWDRDSQGKCNKGGGAHSGLSRKKGTEKSGNAPQETHRRAEARRWGVDTAGWEDAVTSLIWKEQRLTEKATPQSGRLWRTLRTRLRWPYNLPIETWVMASFQPHSRPLPATDQPGPRSSEFYLLNRICWSLGPITHRPHTCIPRTGQPQLALH